MLRRTIRMFITTLCCFLPLSFAFAIGLGEIKLHSHLNDPLKADVPILKLNRTDLGQLKATVASKKEYEKLEIPRDPYLSGVELSIQKNKRGGAYIYAYSDEPVIDPVINLVVSLTSPEGRFVRNYTLFFDPPDYSEAVIVEARPETQDINLETPFAKPPKADLVADITTEVTTTVAVEPALPPLNKAFIPEPAPLVDVAVTTTSSVVPDVEKVVVIEEPVILAASSYSRNMPKQTNRGVYGPTKYNQTLWNVAKHIAPQSSGNMSQIVWALYEANPNVFAYDNINGLKAGSRLNIPSEKAILSVNTSKAKAAMRQQRRVWNDTLKGQKPKKPAATLKKITPPTNVKVPKVVPVKPSEPLKPVSQSTRDASKSTVKKSPAQVLSVDNKVATTAEQAPSETKTVTGNSTEVSKLRASLAASADALTTEKQKNQALSQQVQSLNSEITDLEQEIDQTRTKIKTLQTMKPDNAPTQPGAQPEPQPESSQRPETVPTANTTPNVVTESETIKTFTEKTKQHAESAEADAAKVLSADDLSAAVVDSNYLLIGLGVLVALVLGAVALFWHRQRKRRNGSETKQFFQDVDGDEEYDEEDDDLLAEDEFSVADNISSDSIQAPSIDAEEEASVFMAYGRFEKAINVLRQAIAEKPNDLNLKMMLLECYASTHNHEGFEHIRAQLPADLSETNIEAWKIVDKLMNTTQWTAADADTETTISDHDILEDLAEPDLDENIVTETEPVDDVVHLEKHATSDEEQLDDSLHEPDSDELLNEPQLDDSLHEPESDELLNELHPDEPDESLTNEAEEESESDGSSNEPHVIDFSVDEAAQQMMNEEANLHETSEDLMGMDFETDDSEAEENESEKSIATKLDLARVYIEMDDHEEARQLLEDVVANGDNEQKASAQEMLDNLTE